MTQIKRKRAFTLIEMVVASVVSIVIFALFWSLMRQSTQASSRMTEVMKLMDGAIIQTRIDDDIRTAMEVVEPELLIMSQTLVFYNRKYERITYEFKPLQGTNEFVLERTCGKNGKPVVIARRLKSGLFYRTGPNLVEYELIFFPVKKVGALRGQRSVELNISSKVFLGNGLY